MTNNIFNKDRAIECECGKFIDKYLWNKSKANATRIQFDTKEHKRMQRRGIDIVIERDGKKVYIDEKAKVSGYVNQPVTKVSVEILSWNKKGWFINEENDTNIYAFVCISCDSTVNTETDIKEETINEMNYVLIPKKQLQEWICKQTGRTLKELEEDATEYLESRRVFGKQYNESMYLTKKDSWSSRPVNLVLYMNELVNLPFTRVLNITKDGYRKLSAVELTNLYK